MPRPSWNPTEREVDLALLLIARSATIDQAGQAFGVSGYLLKRELRRIAPEAFASAKVGRKHLLDNHGTVTRYEYAGCRCVVCRDANAERTRKFLKGNPRSQEVVATYSATYNRKHGPGCPCDPCDRKRKRSREQHVRNQEKVAPHVRRGRQHMWTGPELEIVLATKEDGTYLHSRVEAARIVGRSYYAVAGQRALSHTPRSRFLAG